MQTQSVENDHALIARIGRRNLHDDLLASLRDSIIEGRLKSGERLNERFLCERFEVSRTPLREAFKVLAAEGLLTLMPNRGAMVTPLSEEDLAATVEVMAHIETLVGHLAAASATPADVAAIGALHHEMYACFLKQDIVGYFRLNQRIHLDLVALTRNRVLVTTYGSLNGKMKRYRYVANQKPERWRAAIGEHVDILAALDAGDGERLGALLHRHLLNKAASLEDLFRPQT